MTTISNINVFTVIFDRFDPSLMNKSFNFFKKKILMMPSFWMVVFLHSEIMLHTYYLHSVAMLFQKKMKHYWDWHHSLPMMKTSDFSFFYIRKLVKMNLYGNQHYCISW